MEETEWMDWIELPWLQRSAPAAPLLRLCDRITSLDSLEEIVSTVAGEFGVPQCGIADRAHDWKPFVQRGDLNHSLPSTLFADVIDRNAGVLCKPSNDNPVLVVPTGTVNQDVMIFSGSRLDRELLPEALAVARVVGKKLAEIRQLAESHNHVLRLRSTLEIARSCAGEKNTQNLLERLAEAATKLLGCDRASIFVWDRDQQQLVACPALGVEGGRLWLPDNKGIVGEVVHAQQPIVVHDAYNDDRFDASVDKKSGYTTRNLMAVPLFDAAGQCLGAFELINKQDGDFDETDIEALEEFGVQVATAITNTQELEVLVRSNQELTERAAQNSSIIGESDAIVAMRSTINRLAATDLPVLILGESGTGKEVAAQALHNQGPRAPRPFVAINCAALTETLLESELFGHEKGAFTDANSTHIGKFELAEGGTLFLDEIGDMSLGGQAKLLRVLEQKVITRVGGTQPIPVNVRVLAATNASLPQMVADKKFRQDLYYRLSVVTLDLPPLRERPQDILPLAKHFLKQFCANAKRPVLEFNPDAAKRLHTHTWPGNIRELRNLMERVAFLSAGNRVEVEDLAFILSPKRDAFDDVVDGVTLAEATSGFQREYIKRAVKRMQGNMSETAEQLGLHRSNLYRKMRQLGMEVDDVK